MFLSKKSCTDDLQPDVAMAFCANWVGSKGLDRIPEKMFRLVFKVLLTALALRLAWKGLSDLGYI